MEFDSKLLEASTKAFFKEFSPVKHHIDSFDRFIDHGMQEIINEVASFEPNVLPPGFADAKVKFGGISIEKPQHQEIDGSVTFLTPGEARIRDLTYASPLMIKLTLEHDGVEEEPASAELGKLPIMVRSKVCPTNTLSAEELIKNGEDPDDPGGYFIINGTERVIIAIEDLIPNLPLLENKTSTGFEVARLFSEIPGLRIPHMLERTREGLVRVSFTRVSKIPLTVLFKALGIKSDKQMMEYLSADDRLAEEVLVNLEAIKEVESSEDALDKIGREMRLGQGKEYRIQRVQNVIDQFLLPHLGTTPSNRIEKARFLGKLAERLLFFHLKVIPEDDKDCYENKRLKLAGDLMQQLFRSVFRAMVQDMRYSFERIARRGRVPPLNTIIRSQLFSQRLESALGTGYWVGGRTGVSQHLQRLNFMDTISHLRRVLSPLTTSQPHFEARQLHPTHWGKLCASETPEGQNIGLRKNLALLARVTYESDTEAVLGKIRELGVK